MTQSTQIKQNTTKYLVYGAMALLLINFILIFLPFLEIYQPSYSKNILGVTTYGGWYTQLAPMALFIIPIFVTGIPYACAIYSIINSFIKKKNKNVFFKIINNTVDKPVKFLGLKLGAIANVIGMVIIYSIAQSEVSYLERHGAYCHITFLGIINILFTVAFAVLLFVLSHQTKTMVISVSKEPVAETGGQQNDENETKENVR